MSTITQSDPEQRFTVMEMGPQEAIASGEGNELFESYFEYEFVFPVQLSCFIIAREMTDRELILAAEKVGTFSFWDAPSEDVYNTLLNE
jgi:hypothetical protein